MWEKSWRYMQLLLWIVGLLSIGFIIGQVTRCSVDGWYNTIERSMLTPPNYVFGIVWSVIYIMIASAGWLLWLQSGNRQLKNLFLTQLILNWAWSPLFFIYHLVNISLLVVALLMMIVGFIIKKGWYLDRIFASLLVPYFLWLSFAFYLNGYIFIYN